MTMDFTRPLGGVQGAKRESLESFDENEELTMELTTVLGGIKAAQKEQAPQVERPRTPRESLSPAKHNKQANTTPKDQDRFRSVEDFGATKLPASIVLKPVFANRCTNSIFVSAGMLVFSFCRPSRGPTSIILT